MTKLPNTSTEPPGATRRIAVAHRNIVSRDAIGNDILGMHDVLAGCGFEVELIGEHFDTATKHRARTVRLDEASGRRADMLIYHHSIMWERGEELLRKVTAPRFLRYHNVTPPEFFADYSVQSVSLCRAGRAQTKRLVALCDAGCLAASAYNGAELAAAGARSVSVVPPFTGVSDMLRPARPLPQPPFRILFVGRLAPHKGHLDLLNVVAAYVATIGREISLTIVGGTSPGLLGYRAEIGRAIARLGLTDHVELLDQVDEATLDVLFTQASLFLNMSEHEGFSVPIIEAQAAGVPVIAANQTAVGETIGSGQMLVERPRRSEDYLYIAKLIHAACTDAKLRRQIIAFGHRNVLNRFTPQRVASRFMEALAPVLERQAAERRQSEAAP